MRLLDFNKYFRFYEASLSLFIMWSCSKLETATRMFVEKKTSYSSWRCSGSFLKILYRLARFDIFFVKDSCRSWAKISKIRISLSNFSGLVHIGVLKICHLKVCSKPEKCVLEWYHTCITALLISKHVSIVVSAINSHLRAQQNMEATAVLIPKNTISD